MIFWMLRSECDASTCHQDLSDVESYIAREHCMSWHYQLTLARWAIQVTMRIGFLTPTEGVLVKIDSL